MFGKWDAAAILGRIEICHAAGRPSYMSLSLLSRTPSKETDVQAHVGLLSANALPDFVQSLHYLTEPYHMYVSIEVC